MNWTGLRQTLHTLSRAARWRFTGASMALPMLLALLALPAPGGAQAQDDPPGRVGRLADFQGGLFWFDPEAGRWADAERNRPLTAGDRLATAPDGHAELRVGSTTLRLGESTELEVVQLDDARMSFQLHEGQLALRVRSREVAREIEIATAEARLRPVRGGHYRIERIDDSTFAGVWRGELQVDDRQPLAIVAGQRVELFRDAAGRELRAAWGRMPDDAFGVWAVREDRRDDQRSASQRYVSPEMTGAEDLDAYGRWDYQPDYGAIWYPMAVPVGWAPYRYGRWVWVSPWGWTWVDDARWGFAPFHYGRWIFWGGRWGWVPGPYVVRPVFAPALVAWVGGANWGVGVQVGGAPVGWVPLAPREAYVPWYRHTPRYGDRINAYALPRPPAAPRPGPGGRPDASVPTPYANAGVPGGVTVVPRDVLVGRQPVGRAVVPLPAPRVGGPAPGVVPVPPPAAPVRPDSPAIRPGVPPSHGGAPLPPRPFPERPPRTVPDAPTRGVPPSVQPVPGGAVPLPVPAGPRQGTPLPSPAAPVVPAPPPVSREGGTAPDPRRAVPPGREPGTTDPRHGRGPAVQEPAVTPGAAGPRVPSPAPTAPRPPSVAPAAPAPAPAVTPPRPAPPPAAAPQAPRVTPPTPATVPAPPARTAPPPQRGEGASSEEGRKRIPEPRPPSRNTEATR